MKSKILKLGLKDTKGSILYHSFNHHPIKTLLISFKNERRVLSTREGFKEVKAVGNNSNPPPLWDLACENWDKYLHEVVNDLGYREKDIALLSTGVDIDNLEMEEEEFGEFKVICLATAGVASNAQRSAEDTTKNYEKDGKFFKLGTINIILLTNASLSDGALSRAIITITEAKTKALQDLDIRSSYTPLINQATGTGTDNIIVVSGEGAKINYVGGHTKMGESIARVTAKTVKKAILKQNGLSPSRSLQERLKERGITLNSLIQTGLEMYIPDSRIGDKEKVEKLLREEFSIILKDINVVSLILAGLKLEEEGQTGSLCELPEEEYRKDPVYLIADEILGIQIATYIGGTRALFEFARFDREKPGILKTLPPFLDDVMGGLISGVMVKVCSR